jgi:hypothetical protein
VAIDGRYNTTLHSTQAQTPLRRHNQSWPVASYYNQQGADEFLEVPPDFWNAFKPPRSIAPPGAPQVRGRTRGKQCKRPIIARQLRLSHVQSPHCWSRHQQRYFGHSFRILHRSICKIDTTIFYIFLILI